MLHTADDAHALLFIYLLILHLRDPLLDVALLWLYRWLYSPFKWLNRCYLFLFHPYLHQTDVFFLSPFPSPPSVPPSLPDTVCVSRCVLGLSGWPLFLLHSFIIPRIHPSLYPLIFVQSVDNCGFCNISRKTSCGWLTLRLLNVMLNVMGVLAILNCCATEKD